MAKEINIDDILAKHSPTYKSIGKSAADDDKVLGKRATKAAIKEIVEEVLKLAAENACPTDESFHSMQEGSCCDVDKQSILDTAEQINYN